MHLRRPTPPTNVSPRRSDGLALRILRAPFALFLGLASTFSASAATRSWLAAPTTPTVFSNTGNWNGGTAPASSITTDIAQFGNTSAAGSNVNFNSAYSLNGLTFNASSVAYNLYSNTSSTLTIGANGIVSSSANATVFASNLTLTLGAAAPLTVSSTGNLTVNGTVNTGGFVATLNGNGAGTGTLAGTVAGTGNITKSGTGTWVLSGNNTYTGLTQIQGGVLSVNTLANAGVNSALGAATGTNATIKIGSTTTAATLRYTGSGSTTNRAIDLSGTTGGATLDASGSGAITFSNTSVTATGAGSKTLTLTGSNTGNNTLSGVIVNNSGTNLTSLIKSGNGTWVLGGNSTYTGTTQIQGGTLIVSNLANGGTNSNLGAATGTNGTIKIGSTTTGATLQYTGSGGTTNRAIDLAGTTGGATLDASGSGNITFSNTALTASGAGIKTLTLTGNNTGNNTLTGAIVNNSGTNYTNVYKDGVGTWILGGNSTYTGNTTVNAGTLVVTANNNLGTAGNGTTVNSGGTLGLQGGITYSTAETVSVVGTGASGRNGAIDNLSGTNSFAGVITPTGNATIAVTSGNLTLSGGVSLGASVASASTVTFNPAAGTSLTVSGKVTDALSSVDLIVAHTGNGNVILSNTTNDYYGNTILGSAGGNTTGTLTLGGTGALSPNTTLNLYSGTLDLNGNNQTTADNIYMGGGGAGSTAAITTGAGTLTLGNNTSINYDSTNDPNGATIAGKLALGTTAHTFTVADSANATSDLAISAVISGSGNIVKSGTGTLALSGNNTYTGQTQIQSGTLSVNTLANGGTNSALGAATGANGTIKLGSTTTTGTLQYTGAATTTNRAIDLAGTTGGATLDASGSGNITFSNTSVTASGVGAKTLTLTGNNTGSNTLSGNIVNSSSGATSLVKSGNGTWVLGGAASSYTGQTQIQAGTLSVSTLANGGTNSNLGAATGANGTIKLGNSTTTGTLQYTGGTASTDRGIDLAGTTGGGTLDASGSGAVTFSNTAVTASGSGNKTLTLTGNNTGANTLAGAIANGFGSVTSVYKDGSGTWVLSGNSTYTGNTTVNLGTLKLGGTGNATAGPLGGTGGSTIVNSGGALDLNGNTLASAEALNITGSGVSSTGALTNSGAAASYSGAVSLGGNATIGGTGNITLSGGLSDLGTARTLTKAGSSTLNLTAAATSLVDGTAINVSAGTLNSNQATALGTLANVTVASGATFGVGANQTIGALNSSSGAGTVTLGSNVLTLGSTNNLSGSYGGVISGTGSLVKSGTGTQTLTGTNNFTGGITVSNGVLAGYGNTGAGGFGALGNYTGLVSPTNVITVSNGASLAVSSGNTTGLGTGTTTALQTLVLNGSGYNGGGALVANGGVNTWTGNISLGSNSTITNNGAHSAVDANLLILGAYTSNPPLTLALNGHTLTFNGTGDTYLTESIGTNSSNVNTTADTGSVIINGGTDASTVYYAGIRNTYTGDTNVNRGILELIVDSGNNKNSAIVGNLTIGTNSGTTTAKVIDFYSDQIKDTAVVTINSDGTLDLGTFSKSEDIGKLILNGGTVSTGTGLLYLADVASGPNVSVTGTNLTSTISGVMWLQGSAGSLTTRTIDVAATDTLNLTANVFGGNLVKTGSGTMMMNFNNAANGYTGTTTVAGGILNIQNGGALGGAGAGAASYGTIVNSGATLQLQAVSGNIAVGNEALTLNGTGYNSLGALNSKAGGNNTWTGGVTLGSNATVNTDSGSVLTVNGTLTGTATTGTAQYLTAGGAGNTTYAGAMSDGSGGGSLGLIKADSGTVTISGSNSFSGTIAVNAGTLVAGANNTLGNQANAVSIASGATLNMTSGPDASHVFVNSMSALTGSGTITVGTYAKAILNVASTDTFDGLISGTGTFNLNGDSSKTGTLTLTNGANNFAGTLAIDRGELDFSSSASGSYFANVTIGNGSTVTTLKLNNANITFGTLTINGDTILDFGNSGASILNTTNIYIAAGATLTVKNWDSEVDFLYASTHFSQISGTDATKNQIGTTPENQVKFANTFDADGAYTTWTDNSYYYGYGGANNTYGPYQNRQIRPVPEPATYGAIFMAAALGFLGYRQYRRRKQA
ncbi:MAG: autotransporter-associated beta strand repeat-containing protein [Verrucomicrobia bacterium]|nr:autotransporter-associated beta strand repeat-containing protein [Verrucomicrobiota bacterium]